jgi:hypothetical protein
LNFSLIDQQTGGTRGADIAAAAITMTSGRERVVNFLKPFQHIGLTAVVRRPETTDEQTLKFSIFQPLTPALWALILLSTLIVRAVNTLCDSQKLNCVFA